MENGLMIAAATLGGLAGLAALIMQKHKWARVLRRGLWATAALLALTAFGLMLGYLLTDRFEYSYVSGHSAKAQAALYKISALWAGQEGSFLLWSAVLAVTGLPLLLAKDGRSARVFGVYALISACVFAMCAVSQPFARQAAAPADGLGLTAALQNPWMAAHPLLVFVAYSAMAALAAHTAAFTDAKPPDSVQKWTRFAWVTLGLGIFTGSVWAYNALGWGGFWAWDPIENAALVPWLILCGYLHTGERAGRARCVLPFAAACVGTFLTRSGILGDASAHAYTEGDIAVSVLIAVLMLGAAGWLIAAKLRGHGKAEAALSGMQQRNGRRLFAAVAYVYAALVFAGTMAPLVIGAETPVAYYTAISVAFAISYTALLLWQDKEALKRRVFAMLAKGTAAAVGAAFALGRVSVWPLLLLWVCAMPLALWTVSGFRTQSCCYYLRHAGIVLMVLGIVLSLGLGVSGVAVADPHGAGAVIGGLPASVTQVLGSDVTILSSPLLDVIARGGQAAMMADGSAAIPFETRPMILLFWIGGFLTALGPWLVALFMTFFRFGKRKNKRKQSNPKLTGV